MEIGKLKSTGATPIFYFILDPITPDNPSPTRLQHYFVSSPIDSYVEAFNFLCRSLCVPPTDASLKKWCKVHSNLFGPVTFDSFCRAVQTLPVRHFHLETSEGAARAYLSSTAAVGSSSTAIEKTLHHETRRVSPSRTRPGSVSVPEQTFPGASLSNRETHLLVYPQRSGEDPALELHRLRAELLESEGQLRMEKSKSKVNGLGDAERTALLYQLESAQKDLEAEKLRSKDIADKLRAQITALQQRMDKLLGQHDDNLDALAAAERAHLQNLEEDFARRESEMKDEFEAAMRDRDRKLNKATLRADTLEQQLAQAMRELEFLREEHSRTASSLLQLKAEREQEESQFKRLRLQYEAMESHRANMERDLARWEEEQRRAEAEIGRLRAESARWRREAERMQHFTASLQVELKDLDAESATTAELLRRKVLRERSSFAQQQNAALRH